jgi:hypothetical protein
MCRPLIISRTKLSISSRCPNSKRKHISYNREEDKEFKYRAIVVSLPVGNAINFDFEKTKGK